MTFEQLNNFGRRTITNIYGVIAQKRIRKTNENEPGEIGGIWIVQHGNYKTDVSFSNTLINEYKLGFGSVIKVDSIKKNQRSGNNRWKTERVEVVNDCHDFHSDYPEYFRRNRIIRK